MIDPNVSGGVVPLDVGQRKTVRFYCSSNREDIDCRHYPKYDPSANNEKENEGYGDNLGGTSHKVGGRIHNSNTQSDSGTTT